MSKHAKKSAMLTRWKQMSNVIAITAIKAAM